MAGANHSQDTRNAFYWAQLQRGFQFAVFTLRLHFNAKRSKKKTTTTFAFVINMSNASLQLCRNSHLAPPLHVMAGFKGFEMPREFISSVLMLVYLHKWSGVFTAQYGCDFHRSDTNPIFVFVFMVFWLQGEIGDPGNLGKTGPPVSRLFDLRFFFHVDIGRLVQSYYSVSKYSNVTLEFRQAPAWGTELLSPIFLSLFLERYFISYFWRIVSVCLTV